MTKSFFFYWLAKGCRTSPFVVEFIRNCPRIISSLSAYEINNSGRTLAKSVGHRHCSGFSLTQDAMTTSKWGCVDAFYNDGKKDKLGKVGTKGGSERDTEKTEGTARDETNKDLERPKLTYPEFSWFFSARASLSNYVQRKREREREKNSGLTWTRMLRLASNSHKIEAGRD